MAFINNNKAIIKIYLFLIPLGQSMVYVADPSAVEKVFRNEGHYPTRSLIDKNVDWIMQRRNEPGLFIFQYVIYG